VADHVGLCTEGKGELIPVSVAKATRSVTPPGWDAGPLQATSQIITDTEDSGYVDLD
jgi:hypothetical protein